ncbi:MAG TPA: trehalose-phosphatase [Candidatus Saccharimonadales bacterium]|nr:trehalose-phosphatase [Candidatus Saccharimonadales bacterium]
MTAGGGPPPERSTTAELAAAVDRLSSAPSPLLVVLDFDGTLAVGSRDPAVASIEPAAQRAMRRLARIAAARPGRVELAVLTGRTVADVASRVRVGGVEYLGDHGLQHATLARGGRPTKLDARSDPTWDVHRDPAAVLATGVARELRDPPWLFVERKGPSVAFHVRQADDVVAARAAVLAAVAAVEAREGLADHGLAHYRGRSVVDLRPVAAGGKREAVDRLVARHRPGAVVALGDELSDVDAFEAVRSAASRPGVVGVTVAVHGERGAAPAELLALADLRLPSARAVGPFLAALGRRLEVERGPVGD